MDPFDSQGEDLTELVIAGMASLTVFLAARAARPRDSMVAAQVRAIVPSAVRMRSNGLSRLLARLGQFVPFDREHVISMLRSAGVDSYPPEAFNGMRLIVGFFGALGGLMFGSAAPVAVPVLAIAGYHLPAALIRRRIAARKAEILSELPDAVELLAICTRAGLNVPLALERVAQRSQGILGGEMRNLQKEIDLGVSRREALTSMGERTGVARLDDLMRLLVNAERFGSKIASSLETFASGLRAERRRRAEEQARRAPVKMLFPLVFLILPAFVLLTVVPLLLGTFQSLGF